MKLSRTLSTIALSALVIIGVSTLQAWTGPTQAAPNGNVSAPLNIGPTQQTKIAGLGLGSLVVTGGSVFNNGILVANASSTLFANPTIFANGIKITSGSPATGKILTSSDNLGNTTWAAAPTGGTTLPTCTNGQVLKNNGSTWGCGTDNNTGTAIISTSCSTGQAVTAINANGTVTCASVAPASYATNCSLMTTQFSAGSCTVTCSSVGYNAIPASSSVIQSIVGGRSYSATAQGSNAIFYQVTGGSTTSYTLPATRLKAP